MADTREILLKLTGRETVSAAAKKAAQGVDQLGDSARKTAADTKGLDRELDRATRSVEELRREIAKTGDVRLFKDLGRAERDVKKLSGLKEAFAKAGQDSAQGFGAQFVGRIGPLLARAPISPPLLAAFAAATPAIGALVAGGVLAGLAGGTVAAGIKVALTDKRVQTAAESLGDTLLASVKQSASSFVPATLDAIQTIRTEFDRLDLERPFRAAASYVAPLARGVTGLVREALPGISSAIERAGPVVHALEVGLVQVGRAAGDAMESIGEGATGAGLVIKDVLTTAALGIKALGETIGGLAKAYALVSLAFRGDKVQVAQDMAAGEIAAKQFEAELGTLVGGLGELGGEADKAAEQLDSLKDAFDRLFAVQLDMDQATIALKNGMVELKEELTAGKRTLDINTQAGRDNAAAVLDQITKIDDLRAATLEQTGSVHEANSVYDAHLGQLRKTLLQMGYNKAEVNALIGRYRAIPGQVTTKVNAQTAGATAALAGFAKRVRSLDGRVITIYTQIRQPAYVGDRRAGEYIPGQGRVPFAAGGPVTGGTPGRDSVPAMLMPGEYVLSRDAVARMGGVQALDAVNHGKAISGGGARSAGGGAPAINLNISAAPTDDLGRALLTWLRNSIRVYGGGSAQGWLGT